MIQRFLEMLCKRRWKGFRIAHHAVLPAQEASYGTLAASLPESLQKALRGLGVTALYDHQTQALERIRTRSHVVVATPTASGKSLIYNLAVGEALLQDPGQRALYLFPIKALARDQLEALNVFFDAFPHGKGQTLFQAAIYDGDTTPYQRTKIRSRHPHILLTNPDMLHYALLPYHAKWEAFWKQLRFVIVDELHTYRGVFGSHVAQIFRRLQRICRFYGSSPQFIMLSATIANPRELAQQLIGKQERDLDVVHTSGAPQARRHFVFLESEEGQGSHASTLAAQLLTKAAEAGLKTIAFTQARKITELIHMSVLRMAPQLASRVSSYRAGFLPEERRVIEQKLASGELAAVISTSALEMGIDIGGLDLCILVGYPGTVMTTWQRGGRVGRSGRESAIVLLPQYDALDQYIVHHPEEFLQLRYEIAVTDPLNEEILKAHLPCAAAELPLDRAEIDGQEPALGHQVTALTQTGALLQTADGKQWLSAAFHPHRQIDIRSAGPAYVILKNSDTDRHIPLGKSEGIRALKECHPGAIYLHRGGTYQVQSLDLANRVIRVEPSQASYFTRVKSEKETEILEILASKPVENFLARLGRVKVTETIIGYEKRRLFSQELLGMDALELPQQIFETVGFWIEIEPDVVKRIQASKLHFMGGIHAVEHALISMFPLFALCDRNDIGGISIPLHPQVEKAAIFIYDGYPGGIGLAARGYEIILPLLEKTRDLIASCTCPDGCPACIHSPKCGSGNKPLDKEAALAILKYLLGEWNFSVEAASCEAGDDRLATPAVRAPKALPPPRLGFFDIETQRLADEVGGWQNKHLMKLSVAVLFDTHRDAFEVFRENEVTSLIERLQDLDLVVGFNLISFDYEVLRAYSPFKLHQLPTFDLLKEIRQVLGFRLSLAHLAQHNLGQPKMADGVQAVTWFRQGNWEALIKYCTMDVMLTRDLFYRALETGYLLYQDRQGRSLRIPTPWHLEELLRRRDPGP